MVLELAEPPIFGLDAVRRAVDLDIDRSGLGGAPKDQLNAAAPHPVFDLALDEVASMDTEQASSILNGAARTDPSRWRYLITNKSNAIASVEVLPEGNAPPDYVSFVNRGPYVRGTQTAIVEAENLPEVLVADFELRLVRVSALLLMLLWLKSKHGDEDLFIPISPSPKFLEPGHVYKLSEILPLLQSAAVRQRELDSAAETEAKEEVSKGA